MQSDCKRFTKPYVWTVLVLSYVLTKDLNKCK